MARSEKGIFELTGRAGNVETPLPAAIDIPDNEPDREPRRLGPARPTPEWLTPLAAPLTVEIVAPLWHDTKPVALLGFGRRWDEEIFDDEDIVVLELMAQQALLYLQVAQQIDDLRQVPHQISEAQERERTLLAAELHDTIQQFLGRLPFFLVASKEAMADDPEDAAELLERSLSDIEEAAQSVQRIRQNLAPSQLDRSLTRSLSALAAHTEQRYGIEVPLEVSDDVDEATDLETRHALYRIVQHALDNATMHAEASHVMVSLQQEDGQIIFDVQDDGRGATPEELALARRMGHFGLQSMQARVEACGGQLEFISRPGCGARIAGWVPTANSDQR
jgi:signal transduction histidine kinase